MFFSEAREILQIAKQCGTAIFIVSDDVAVDIPKAITLRPEGKSVITIEQVRGVLARLNVRQTSDLYILIRPAEALATEAANALLKSLEEPGERVHFVLISNAPSQIIPTVLSRASLYILQDTVDFSAPINEEAKVRELARRLMVARGNELVAVAEDIAKHKNGVRDYALRVVGTAIQMLYKTYFLTNKTVFVDKLPKFLAAYDSISLNGHIKLQIVANLC